MATPKKKINKNLKLNLANPVTLAASRITTLLNRIPGIATAFDYEKKTLTVYVSDIDKLIPVQLLLKRKHDVGGGLFLNVDAYDVGGVVPEKLGTASWTITDQAMFGYLKDLLKGFCWCGFTPQFSEVKMPKSKDVFRYVELPPVAMCYHSDSLANPHGVSAEFPADLFMFAFTCEQFRVSTLAQK